MIGIGLIILYDQFNNKHFKKCNDWLAERYGEDGIIDWSLVPSKKAIVPPVADKENSAALANISSSPAGKSEGKGTSAAVKANPVEDEFDDADALEALVAAEKDEEVKV